MQLCHVPLFIQSNWIISQAKRG